MREDRSPPGAALSKALLLSVVYVPILLGMLAAGNPRPRRALRRLVLAFFAFDLVYAAFLYYVYLRIW